MRSSYFQPSDQNTDLPQKPRVSSDLALNAFAQLAALKLNCERSFISLMDHEHQYIIAEVCLSIQTLVDRCSLHSALGPCH